MVSSYCFQTAANSSSSSSSGACVVSRVCSFSAIAGTRASIGLCLGSASRSRFGGSGVVHPPEEYAVLPSTARQ